jgi:hypothetical protein
MLAAQLLKVIFAPFLTSGIRALRPPGSPPGVVFERSQAVVQLGDERRVRRFVDALELVGFGLHVVELLLAVLVLEVGVAGCPYAQAIFLAAASQE